MTDFATLGLDPKIVAGLTELGYEEPTPIQRAAIPPLLAGRDVLGQAATGTGKTAAFSLPLLQGIRALDKAKRSGPSALILTPTRELAVQVAEALTTYGRGLGVTVLPVYGGADMRQQLRALSRGIDIVVATPGRAVDHIRRKSLALKNVRMVVLDEADEMLDMGFAEDLEAILSETPADRQTALFSATMASRVGAVAKRHLKDPVHVTIARDAGPAGAPPLVRQVAYIVPRAYKIATLGRVLDIERPTSALIFCRTRTEVDELNDALRARGSRTEALHGGMSQIQRDRVMKQFRANTIDLLIATDVAARGLDIAHLSCVVNYDVPTSPEAYVHRIGRTGRAGREGLAVTLAEPREQSYLRTIERSIKQKIEIATVPTVNDLRARRLDVTRAAIQQVLLGGGLDAFRAVVNSLVDGKFTAADVAAAALKAAHEARGNTAETETEIPVFDTTDRGASKKHGKSFKHKSPTPHGKSAAPHGKPAKAGKPEKHKRTREYGYFEARPGGKRASSERPHKASKARRFAYNRSDV